MSKNQYEQINQVHEQKDMHHDKANNQNKNAGEIIVTQKTDAEFFTSLEKYYPLWYDGNGSPTFLVSYDWRHPAASLLCMDLFLAGSFILFLIQSSKESEAELKSGDKNLTIMINIGAILFLNLFYFLTLSLNPGVRNLSSVSVEQYEEDGKIYCQGCCGFKTKSMYHCKWCGVCVEGLDHHCGFFGKCIAGNQKYAFYCCILLIFVSFVSIILSLSILMGL